MMLSIQDEGYVETIRGLLEFLQTNGFPLTAETFITEVENRISGEALVNQPEADEAAATADAEITPEPDIREPGPPEAVDAAGPPLQTSTSATSTSLALQLIYSRQESRRETWDGEVDEYENAEDVGYLRKDITDQHQFIKTELEVVDEDLEQLYAQQQTSTARSHSTGSSPSLESFEIGNNNSSSPFSAEHIQSQVSGQLEENWDEGPKDIKLAAPVVTDPSPSCHDDSPRRLSRVESLSNSFIDDNESADGNLSTRQSDAGSFDPEVADHIPAASPASPEKHQQREEKQEQQPQHKTPDKPSSSVQDAAPRAQANIASSEVVADVIDKDTAKQEQTPPSIKVASATEGDATAAAGGFSFALPVTPASEEPDQMVFKSWPSIHSSPSRQSVEPNRTSDDEASPQHRRCGEPVDLFARAHSQHSQRSEAADDELLESGWLSRRTSGVSNASPTKSQATSSITSAAATPTHPAAPPPTAAAGAAAATDQSTPASPGALMAQLSELVLADSSAAKPRHSHQRQGSEQYSPQQQYHDDTATVSTTDEHMQHLEGTPSAHSPYADPPMPKYTIDDQGMVTFEFDQDYVNKKYQILELKVIHRKHRTGFEESKDFPIRINDLIAGRYHVTDFLGAAAFSRAVQATDIQTGSLVCLKIIKNNKDYLDQSLDEIKLLKYVNDADPADEHGIVRLYDFFYYKEHLFLVCELLRANLYEFQKYNRESGDEAYFTLPRIQSIARQVLRSLAFLHSLGLIHSDLKPENILIRSYSRCEVKVIDLGSSCFVTDHLSSYVQSRSYRAPEVILGLPYNQKVDIWSLGCILAELASGSVLFQNDSLATLLARLEGILGAVPRWMVKQGRYGSRFYSKSGRLYERGQTSGRYELLLPKRTSLKHRVSEADEGFLDFLTYLLAVDPAQRPSADEALLHPWLQHCYPEDGME